MKVTEKEAANKMCPLLYQQAGNLKVSGRNCIGKLCMMFQYIGEGVSDSYVYDLNNNGIIAENYESIYICGLTHQTKQL